MVAEGRKNRFSEAAEFTGGKAREFETEVEVEELVMKTDVSELVEREIGWLDDWFV